MISTKNELDSAINNCISQEAGIEIYIGLKGDEIRKANISADLQPEVLSIYKNELSSRVLDVDYNIQPVSTSEEGKDIIYRYDLDVNKAFEIFDDVLDATREIPDFSFEKDGLVNICFLLLVISTGEHHLVAYKTMQPINVYNHKKGLFIRKSDNRFGKVTEDFLRITQGIEFMKVNNEIFVFNIGSLERSFKINEILIKSAQIQIEKLEKLNLVSNIDKLKEFGSDKVFARKMSKFVDNSPILSANIKTQEIIKFVRNNSDRIKHIKITNDDKLLISSKEAAKVFLKLINDDYLVSELSSIKYDSLHKEKQ